MDKGIIGMSAFMEDTQQVLPAKLKTKEIYEQEEIDYALSGEWGKLSEEQQLARVKEMELIRKKNDAKVAKNGSARTPTMLACAIVALLVNAKQHNLLPEIMTRFFPTMKQVGVAIATILSLYAYLRRAAPIHNKNLVNPAPYLPILGHTLSVLYGVNFKDLHSFFREIIEQRAKYQPFEISAMEGLHGFVLTDPVDRRYVLKDNWKNFLKNSSKNELSFEEIFPELFGRGVFGVDKREWQDHRKVAATMFSVNGLRSQMERVFLEHGNKFCAHLERYANTGEVVDMQALFQAFTFDTICEIAFGIDTKAVDQGSMGKKVQFLVSFDQLQIISTKRLTEPISWWKLKRAFLIGDGSELYSHYKYVRKYVLKVVTDRLESPEFSTKKDLLSLYIAHARKSGQTYMEEKEYLMDVIINFMIAGRDTTSCALTNWFKSISQSPRGNEITDAIVSECKRLIPEGTDPNWEAVQKLTYADAVFNEVLRMYPSVATESRFAENDDVLPSGNLIKAGMLVFISNYSIGRQPDLWHDPNTFIPERWIQKDETTGEIKPIRRPDEYVLPVFWAGSRLCLGKDMARFEAKLLSMLILRRFRFDVKPVKEAFVNGPVMFYSNPVNTVVRKV